MFHKITGKSTTILVLYVDDLILATNCKETERNLAEYLKKEYKLKELGELSWCLGMEVIFAKNHIQLSQRQFIKNMLEKFEMTNCKPQVVPMQQGLKLQKRKMTDDEKEHMKRKPYRQLIGSLLFASVLTRPDISAAVSKLARYMDCPAPEHWNAAKGVLRYLKGTWDLCLTFARNEEPRLVCYSDASWADDLDTRRSTSGMLCLIGSTAVSWSSKAQKSVALSTAEAEYMALSATAQELVWFRRLLKVLQIEHVDPTIIWEDNQSAIKISEDPVQHSRTKHIDTRYHFVRELVKDGLIAIEYCPTDVMVADILTKALPGPAFKRLREMMGLCPRLQGRSGSDERSPPEVKKY